MKNVGFVTGPIKECGIHTYAMCVMEILKKSKKYNFHLLEVSNTTELLNLCQSKNIEGVIYNWHPAIMPWCTPDFVNQVTHLKQYIILGHELSFETKQFTNISGILTVDPLLPYVDISQPGVRPITYYDDITYSPPGSILKIGTSGFGQQKKGFDALISILNQQFVNEDVILNVHSSVGYFVDPSGHTAMASIRAYEHMLRPNIKLNITHQFFEKRELIQWLNGNDINLYCYHNYDGPGVSSSIDKALAARKPIGVNTSNYFKHICKDGINIYKTPIREILANGITPLQEYYNKWNPEKLLEQYEDMIEIL